MLSFADFLNSDLGRWVNERLTGGQSDVVHDLLAFLAEQMIEMNKEKQTEAQGFLAWFERQIGAKIDDLANKTKLRAYFEHDIATLLDVLRQNSGKLEKKIARTAEEEIEREFTKSVDKLRPLLAKIAATDRLIDLIVYRLYGLNNEEVVVVEGRTASEAGPQNPQSEAEEGD